MDYKKTFEQRSTAKISESKCEKYLENKAIRYKRFGWDYTVDKVPGPDFVKLPEVMRSLPDYIIFNNKAYFVEVKGCKHFLRLKLCDMESYTFWNNIMDLFFFIYSSSGNKIYKKSHSDMNEITKHCETKVYPDNNKKYFLIKIKDLE